jgi:hypothetical protein
MGAAVRPREETMNARMRQALCGSATTVILALALAAPASADVTSFDSKASPSSGVKDGTVVTVTATPPTPPGTKFLCVQLALNESTEVNAPKNSSIKTVTSDANGKITCTQTFNHFTAADSAGGTRHCPLEKADVTAGFACGIGLADQATFGQTYGSFARIHVVGDYVKPTTTGTGTNTGNNTNTGTSNGTNTNGNNTSTGPNSVAAGSGGLADRVEHNTPLVVALAALGLLLIGGSGWRLVRR